MKVLFSGGGTLGPVTPLLAIHDIIKKAHPEAEFVWVGTKKGIEKELVEKMGIKFTTVTSGKMRRYISLWNLVDIVKIKIGFFQSIGKLLKEKPDVCISAGGYVSTPVHWAAWLLGIPTWIHQQDVQVGLSNKLMAPIAKVITTALEVSAKHFSKKKVIWLGNPVRQDILSGKKLEALKKFNLKSDLPVVFATGGGTGSQRVNQMIVEAAKHLENKCQMIHLSGRERPQELVERAEKHIKNYQHFKFFTDEMKDAYATADIVISRGGFGTITEIAALGKVAVLIPKPGHQEENVRFLSKAGAVEIVDEKTKDGNYLARVVLDILEDKERMRKMGEKLNKILPLAKEEDILEIFESLD